MTEATKAVQQWRGIGLAGRASTNAATEVASGTSIMVLGHWPTGTGKDGAASEAEFADAEDEEAS